MSKGRVKPALKPFPPLRGYDGYPGSRGQVRVSDQVIASCDVCWSFIDYWSKIVSSSTTTTNGATHTIGEWLIFFQRTFVRSGDLQEGLNRP